MQISRSESHQQDKLKRKKRLRRIIILNFTLLGVIIVVLGAWLAAANSDKVKDMFGSGDSESVNQAETKPADQNESVEGEEEPGSIADTPDSNIGNEQENGLPAADNGEANITPEDGEAIVAPEDDPAAGERISLSFVGDLLVADYVSAITAKEGYPFLYQPSMLYLSEPDITAGNLEFPVTTRGVPVEGTPYVFKGSPEVLPAMRDAGFDIMSLANNHALDQGVEGMLDTMKHLDEAGISHMGAGNNDTEAFAPVIKEVRGIKVAYIGLSRVVPFNSWKADRNVPGVAESYDTRRALEAIAKAKKEADLVVVMVHWGKERVTELEKHQTDFGKQYIDAGADLVIGSHPHVLQGFERYKGKWIAYSLGNFIFSSYPKETAGETGVLDALCTKDGDCEMTFHPMFTVNAQPTPLEGEQAKAVLDRLTSISFGVKLAENGKLLSE
ncbi:poly-gamma-glutamate synthesis protein (capsule biosynthesis protein) [Paenibacillus endophyticus]|uniref:Poly-gamma-glutamate synthesis protein (Capsule biosynthesis protein) n=1 Tax=Paenibacillus endophyticus TaxID=1294268 RepID=A0A7W5C4U5_9BACL|nr:CapA family protein [Paenibacillus endophyticus]MBB3151220.1 poly-gamma-glutamate synthesis protein (capsule biosynthesis protein) [Paenibacillus endophyticus]